MAISEPGDLHSGTVVVNEGFRPGIFKLLEFPQLKLTQCLGSECQRFRSSTYVSTTSMSNHVVTLLLVDLVVARCPDPIQHKCGMLMHAVASAHYYHYLCAMNHESK